MRKILLKGGYGEHGRSCFVVPYGDNRYYMVDCGILDTDSHPNPDVSPDILERTDVMFLTHCHKDHTGAYADFCARGFHGVTVATSTTFRLAGIHAKKEFLLDFDQYHNETVIGDLHVRCGRSGHCPGGLWLEITDPLGTIFFSGDYQEDTLFYAVDPVRDVKAQLAIVDCAHDQKMHNAGQLRDALCETVETALNNGRDIILPVPHYGRGCEIMTLLQERFSDVPVYMNPRLQKDYSLFAQELIWQKEHTPIHALPWDENGHGFLLLGGPHLTDVNDQAFVQRKVAQGALVILTGRLKQDSYACRLYENGQAVRCIYPHHQSRSDTMNLVQKNRFDVVLPFHNNEKEVWFGTGD